MMSSGASKLSGCMCLPPQVPRRTCVRWEMMMVGGTPDTRPCLPVSPRRTQFGRPNVTLPKARPGCLRKVEVHP